MQLTTIRGVLVLLGVILCALAAFGVPSNRVSLGWLGVTLFGIAWLLKP